MAVRIVAWQGVCDDCGEPAPETRDSEVAAQEDADDCPCRDYEDDDYDSDDLDDYDDAEEW